MTGLDGRRVYLDWNATAPLRPEARAAMLAAMDEVGNPSSVHAEGRAAKRIVETARGQVAQLVGCDPSEVVFTSGATEAAAMVLSQAPAHCSDAEHDAVVVHRKTGHRFALDADGRFECGEGDWDLIPRNLEFISPDNQEFVACQSANSETGVRQDFDELFGMLNILCSFNWFVDACQSVGRVEDTFKNHARLSHSRVTNSEPPRALVPSSLASKTLKKFRRSAVAVRSKVAGRGQRMSSASPGSGLQRRPRGGIWKVACGNGSKNLETF